VTIPIRVMLHVKHFSDAYYALGTKPKVVRLNTNHIPSSLGAHNQVGTLQ
jgi:hypothetical protein